MAITMNDESDSASHFILRNRCCFNWFTELPIKFKRSIKCHGADDDDEEGGGRNEKNAFSLKCGGRQATKIPKKDLLQLPDF